MTKVFIMEYERGWGNKIDEVKEFKTREDAEAFCKEYNSKNTSESAPDWYMQAEIQ